MILNDSTPWLAKQPHAQAVYDIVLGASKPYSGKIRVPDWARAMKVSSGAGVLMSRSGGEIERVNLLRTNSLLYNGSFNSSKNWSASVVNSQFADDVSYKITNPGVASSNNFSAPVSGLSNKLPVFSCIFERGVGETATEISIGIYRAPSFAARISFALIAETLNVIAGAGKAKKLAQAGPNGGKVFQIFTTGIITDDLGHSLFLYPTGAATNTNSIIIHNLSFNYGGQFLDYQQILNDEATNFVKDSKDWLHVQNDEWIFCEGLRSAYFMGDNSGQILTVSFC